MSALWQVLRLVHGQRQSFGEKVERRIDWFAVKDNRHPSAGARRPESRRVVAISGLPGPETIRHFGRLSALRAHTKAPYKLHKMKMMMKAKINRWGEEQEGKREETR